MTAPRITLDDLGAYFAGPDETAAFLFGWREDGDSATVTWHNEFARCPGCGNATVGLGVPYGINHAEGCDMPSRAGLRRKEASA